MLEESAEKNKALFIRAELSIPGDSKHFYDTFHFTRDGSRQMAKRVLDALLASEELAAGYRQSGKMKANSSQAATLKLGASSSGCSTVLSLCLAISKHFSWESFFSTS